jgi:hypothetical protein
MVNSAKPGVIIFLSGILGLFVSAIIQIAFDNEWIFSIYFEAADILGLQILTIVAFMILGSVLAALTS